MYLVIRVWEKFHALFFRIKRWIMGKQLGLYRECKNKDDTKCYLFKSGVFYYFLDDDARYFSDKYGFKLTGFGESVKWGFPIKPLEKYLFLFQNEKIEVVKEFDSSGLINKIRGLNLDDLSPSEAFVFLKELKEEIYNE